jgi:ribonuclease J
MLMAGSLFAGPKTEIPRDRQTTLETRKTINIGGISVTGLSVDHSAYDSMAFLIEADGKRLLYSGDLRLHGRKRGMARALYKFIAEKPVDILLMEGTNFRKSPQADGSDNFTEKDLEDTICRAIKRWNHLVLAHFSPQHFDRMISFFKATRDAGRIFVVDAYGAFVWDVIRRREFRDLMAKKQIRVYFNQSFQHSWRKNIPKLNRPFLAASIDLPAILAEQERYTMLFRPSMLDLDFGGQLPKHALCLHSLWGGYLVKPEYIILKAAITSAEGEFSECHTSGHISAEDIEKFVKAVNPRYVVPIHTTGRSEFQKRFKNVLVVEDGQEFDLDHIAAL